MPGLPLRRMSALPERAVVLLSRVETGKWKPLSVNGRLPDKRLVSSWVWVLQDVDGQTTRLVVRVRSDYSPRLLSTLSAVTSTELGSLVMQPEDAPSAQPAGRDEHELDASRCLPSGVGRS
jgi:hypothetical protein